MEATHASGKFDLEERTMLFARNVRSFAKELPRTEANLEDIPQLIRASGSVAANYIEANESLGKKDFLMRIRICLKESKESALWLRLLEVEQNSSLEERRKTLLSEAQQFVRIFNVIFHKSQKKLLNIG